MKNKHENNFETSHSDSSRDTDNCFDNLSDSSRNNFSDNSCSNVSDNSCENHSDNCCNSFSDNSYIETLLAQIREKRAKESIRQEIENHLEEQQSSYIAVGMTRDSAMRKAVADMGDPVETGAALDRIHRPRPAFGMLAVIAVLCFTGVLLQYTMLHFGGTLQQEAYFFKKQCLYAAVGFVILCAVYLTDYTRIARYSRQLCAGMLLFLFFQAAYGTSYIHSKPYWLAGIKIFGIVLSPSLYLYLYIPLYCAVLYSYRNCQKKDLLKILLYTILPVCISCRISYLHVTLNLTVILLLLSAAAVKKGWFHTAKGRFFHKGAILIPAGMLAFLIPVFPLAAYQSERIKAWLIPGYNQNGAGYSYHVIRDILSGSRLIGKSRTMTAVGFLPDCPSDYILTYIIGNFGVFAAAALVILIAMLAAKLLHISIHQKNQLGMIMGLGCSLVFSLQAAEYILVNLSLLPAAGLYFPLISFGGSGMVQICILLGILLSIYRYENVVSEPGQNQPVKTITKLL